MMGRGRSHGGYCRSAATREIGFGIQTTMVLEFFNLFAQSKLPTSMLQIDSAVLRVKFPDHGSQYANDKGNNF